MSGNSALGTVLVKRKANERPPGEVPRYHFFDAPRPTPFLVSSRTTAIGEFGGTTRFSKCQRSEWELRIRPACQKIRVVEKLLGGAHAMVTGNPSVAVRIYDADDAGRMEGIDDDDAGGVDGLRVFRDSFEHSIVFFVLRSGQQQRDQLGRLDSFVNVAQKSLLRRDRTADDHPNGKKNRTTRTLIVSDASQVIKTIESLVQNLKPEKREKRARYFAQAADKLFLPVKGKQPSKEVIANHVAKTFSAWSERFEMENGDANVALNMLGSLASVATANSRTLDDIPIRNDSKDKISRFFGANTGTADDSTPAEEDKVEAHSNGDGFYDNIDDSELLACPDPTPTNNTSHRASFPAKDNPAMNGSLGNHQTFSGDIDFTPLVSTRQPSMEHPGYNAAPSIFPESFSQQNHFPQRNDNAGYRQVTNYSHGYGFSSNYPNQYSDNTPAARGFRQQHYPPSAGSRGHNYPQGYQDASHGYSYSGHSQSARYHTQQFM